MPQQCETKQHTNCTDLMGAPTVSVIMNCLNNEKYLRDALESVISQSFAGWELIFWDDQSDDKSPEIFQSYRDARFKYYRSERRSKLGKARNLAVAHAKGPWLAFIDCDDMWKKDKLDKQLSAIGNQREMVGFVYCPVEIGFDYNNHNHRPLQKYYHRMQTEPHGPKSIYRDLLLKGNRIIFSSLLMRRDLYIKVGGINDEFSQNEDYDLLLKVSRISNAVCIEDACTMYRIHDANASHFQAELNYKENRLIFSHLPHDNDVKQALKINESRYAVYKMKKGQIFDGIKKLLFDGSPVWAIKRVIERLGMGISRSYSV